MKPIALPPYRYVGWLALICLLQWLSSELCRATDVDGQPLGANAQRLIQALEILGQPIPEETRDRILEAARKRDAEALQQVIDPQVLFIVSINPELRVKVGRGQAAARLHQHGFTPVLV